MHPAIGITGTQKGATAAQIQTAAPWLAKFRQRTEWLNEGDCVGVDDQISALWRDLDGKLRAFIPDNPTKRAWREADVVELPAPYLVRNRAIVDNSAAMIAIPYEMEEQQRGGTWSTWRYAVARKVPTLLILPDGSVRKDNWR